MKVIFFVIKKRQLKIGLVLLLSLLGVALHKPVGRLVYPFPYREEIEIRSEYAGVDPQLVAALIYVESKFDPKARSTKGARGLMQIMPETAAWVSAQKGLAFQVDDLDRPEVNIPLGVWYLGYLFRSSTGTGFGPGRLHAGGEKVKAWLAPGSGPGGLMICTASPTWRLGATWPRSCGRTVFTGIYMRSPNEFLGNAAGAVWAKVNPAVGIWLDCQLGGCICLGLK